jgi:hypothetical protein
MSKKSIHADETNRSMRSTIDNKNVRQQAAHRSQNCDGTAKKKRATSPQELHSLKSIGITSASCLHFIVRLTIAKSKLFLARPPDHGRQ